MSLALRNTIDRAHLICEAGRRAAENAAAAGIDPDTGGGQTWSVALSASGNNPATHYGASSRVTASMRTTYRARASSPFVRIYEESAGWSWQSALADAGLRVIRIPE